MADETSIYVPHPDQSISYARLGLVRGKASVIQCRNFKQKTIGDNVSAIGLLDT